ncbi:uncharacterized protein MELLADRAFT_108002 [Melampsora larici-populina 98AG31]|uniref:Uncharacterized protein n=1 Tax=Melampsora larici-populina (strain 98AG31 / pathotype 3-4-7) TaxID=747676 RepID=F4RRM8_MELLP|nr:uncharacterized protein MELLADRAFT_108002 [Melampsora larici-populina 98AG31]EGG04993.1 hypothetical protein MELLADRAFT_108002 [Melampsora larici-populina 98AG31]
MNKDQKEKLLSTKNRLEEMVTSTKGAEEKKVAQAEERKRRAEARIPKSGEEGKERDLNYVDPNLASGSNSGARQGLSEKVVGKERLQLIGALREPGNKDPDQGSRALINALTSALDASNGNEARRLIDEFNTRYGLLVSMEYDGYEPSESKIPSKSGASQPLATHQLQGQSQKSTVNSTLMDSSQLLASISGSIPNKKAEETLMNEVVQVEQIPSRNAEEPSGGDSNNSSTPVNQTSTTKPWFYNKNNKQNVNTGAPKTQAQDVQTV